VSYGAGQMVRQRKRGKKEAESDAGGGRNKREQSSKKKKNIEEVGTDCRPRETEPMTGTKQLQKAKGEGCELTEKEANKQTRGRERVAGSRSKESQLEFESATKGKRRERETERDTRKLPCRGELTATDGVTRRAKKPVHRKELGRKKKTGKTTTEETSVEGWVSFKTNAGKCSSKHG